MATKKFRKNWRSESAFLRKQAKRLFVVLPGLDDAGEYLLLENVIKDLLARAEKIEPEKPKPVVTEAGNNHGDSANT